MREIKDLKDLKFDKKNYRTHDPENQRLIKKSITEAGLGRSIVVDAENEIIGGNGLVSQLPPDTPVKVIETTGDELVVVKRTDLKPDDEKRKKLALMDNTTGNQVTWNFETLMDDFTLAELPDLGITTDMLQDADPGKNPEDLEEPTAPPIEALEPRVQKGDVWTLGRHRLICGDSTDPAVLRKLTDGRMMDLLLTDPPYNVAIGSKNAVINSLSPGKPGRIESNIENDVMGKEEFTDFLARAFNTNFGVLKPGAVFYIFYASAREFLEAADRENIIVRQFLVWVKNHFTLGLADYQWQHEPILYGWKDGAKHYFVDEYNHATILRGLDEKDPDEMSKSELLDYVKDLRSRIQTDIIEEDKPARNEWHPTMKPIRLMAKLMRNSSRPGEAVLDPFGGSGSTLLAAEQLGRACYTCEIDPRYCDVILHRWEEFTGKEAEKCQDPI